MCTGNHDYYGGDAGIQAEIDYRCTRREIMNKTELPMHGFEQLHRKATAPHAPLIAHLFFCCSDKSDRWTLPDKYYSKLVQTLNSRPRTTRPPPHPSQGTLLDGPQVTGSDGTTFNIVSIDTWRLNSGDTYVLHNSKSGKRCVGVGTVASDMRVSSTLT